MRPLELVGAHPPERRVDAGPVVEALDVLEYLDGSLVAGGEGAGALVVDGISVRARMNRFNPSRFLIHPILIDASSHKKSRQLRQLLVTTF